MRKVYVTFEGFEDPSWPIQFDFTGFIVYLKLTGQRGIQKRLLVFQ